MGVKVKQLLIFEEHHRFVKKNDLFSSLHLLLIVLCYLISVGDYNYSEHFTTKY